MANAILLITPEELETILRRQIDDALSTAPALRKEDKKVFLTNSETSELIGWSLRQLAYKRASGDLPYIKRGRTVLYRQEDIEAFLMEGYVPAKKTRILDRGTTRVRTAGGSQ
jgi:helix-turn-helix protein